MSPAALELAPSAIGRMLTWSRPRRDHVREDMIIICIASHERYDVSCLVYIRIKKEEERDTNEFWE